MKYSFRQLFFFDVVVVNVPFCLQLPLMSHPATFLTFQSMNGVMYTGCDMNTTLEDMTMLSKQCDFVLAAIGNPSVDPNNCTAFGVLGALDAALLDQPAYGSEVMHSAIGNEHGLMAGKVIVVHGCGNVGATVAAELAASGATVYTFDLLAHRANVPGCINISDETPGATLHPNWWDTKCDALVPCSSSGLFTNEVASEIDTRFIIGATNLPFANSSAYDTATSRGARYIPEGCTSAGAVIVDSVEHFDSDSFAASKPQDLYGFVREVVAKKTARLLKEESRTPVEAVQHLVARQEGNRPAIGSLFTNWLLDSAQKAEEAALKAKSTQKAATKSMPRMAQMQRPFSSSAAPGPTEEEAAMKHLPYGAEGTGYYSEATKGCFDVIANAKPLVLEAVRRALASRQAKHTVGTPFHVADFGTADAGTSLPLICEVVRAVRLAEGPATPIVVCYEDQPANDWNSVFKRVHGLLKSDDEEPFMKWGDDNVFVLAAGTSFYKPCFPAQTLDLAFSATAMHWLSVTPQFLPDALHSACSNDLGASTAFAQQAAKDWLRVMTLRENELKRGGQLVLVNFAKDEQGQFLGETARLKHSMHRTFAELWERLVTPEEFEATNFPNQYRSLEDTMAPFETNGGALASSMAVVSAKTEVVSCPFFDAFHGLGANANYAFAGDAAGHAKNYVPTTRTWSNSTFLAGVAGRAPLEQTAIVDELFKTYEQRVFEAPGEHAMDYVHAYAHMEKK